MLKISGDGRRAALDLRLVGLPQTPPGKITAAADRIAAIWHAHTATTTTSTPTASRTRYAGRCSWCSATWAPPDQAGTSTTNSATSSPPAACPARQIRFIHEAKTDRDKAQLFAACRAGRVAVLVGSTEKMGVGTNVQDRAIALHHLDAPWRPADVAQREGRILRQGNLNHRESRSSATSPKDPSTATCGKPSSARRRFIDQVMHGRLDAREINDIGDTALSFSEVKALATGNPLLMDKAEADANLARLQRAERAHHRNQDASARPSATSTPTSPDSPARRRHRHRHRRRQDTRGEKFTMTIDQMHHGKRADAGQHIKDILEREVAGLTGQVRRAVSIGRLGGFAVTGE